MFLIKRLKLCLIRFVTIKQQFTHTCWAAVVLDEECASFGLSYLSEILAGDTDGGGTAPGGFENPNIILLADCEPREPTKYMA